jgi:hypothetical protein
MGTIVANKGTKDWRLTDTTAAFDRLLLAKIRVHKWATNYFV